MQWSLEPAGPSDVETLAELKAVVLRADLERVGRFDQHRVRQRLRDHYEPGHTSLIVAGGVVAGCVALRPAGDGWWLEHFYLAEDVQGRGIGSAVLRTLLDRADDAGVQVRLQVLQGSAARRLYERHGFTLETEDPIDAWLVRRPGGG